MTIARMPFWSDSATFSAAWRHTWQVRNSVSPSFHSPVALSRYRGVDAMRNRATGTPDGVNRSSGSSTRLPVTVMVVSLLMGGPSVLGPAGACRGWFAFAVWRVAALAATALSAAACRRRLSVKRAGRESFRERSGPEGREKFPGGAA